MTRCNAAQARRDEDRHDWRDRGLEDRRQEVVRVLCPGCGASVREHTTCPGCDTYAVHDEPPYLGVDLW